jgi:hypothetical protein
MKKAAKLDQLGRVAVPSDVLKELNWVKSTKEVAQFVSVEVVGDTVVLTKDTEKRCVCGHKLKDRYKYCPECGTKVK